MGFLCIPRRLFYLERLKKGNFEHLITVRPVPQLLDRFGHPPVHSWGIYYAIQALMHHCALLFFRVREEGFSRDDYLLGLNLLQKQKLVAQIDALCMPGVGSVEIIQAITPICDHYHSFLIISESDLYDYLNQAAC